MSKRAFTDAQVIEMRRCYAAGLYSLEYLARKFGASSSAMVNNIVYGRTYADVPGVISRADSARLGANRKRKMFGGVPNRQRNPVPKAMPKEKTPPEQSGISSDQVAWAKENPGDRQAALILAMKLWTPRSVYGGYDPRIPAGE